MIFNGPFLYTYELKIKKFGIIVLLSGRLQIFGHFRPFPPCPQSAAVVLYRRPLKGAGGLHQDFLEIDFLVVSDRGE